MSEDIIEFLNKQPSFPIVSHPRDYDRDIVLERAFKKVKNGKKLPGIDRWKCTQLLSLFLPGVKRRTLDGLLEYFGLKQRNETDYHCAQLDAELCGQIYMKIIKQMNDYRTKKGFMPK